MKSAPNLDLLRSIAVLLVVVEHTLLAMRLHWIGSWNIAWLGVVGVFMFFVHTSLVLMWSLDRKPYLLDFYIRRLFRIYPLAIAAILITITFHIPTLQKVDGSTFFQTRGIKNVIANLLLLQNLFTGSNILGVMWSLPLEVDMYVLLPFLYFFIRRNFVIWPLLVVWIGTVAYTRSAVPDINTFAVCIPYFLSGVIAFVLYAKVTPRLPGFLMPLWALVLLVGFMSRPSWHNGWWLTLTLGVTLPLFRPIRSRLVIRASHEIAKYSYGIYLVHPFSILIGVNLLANQNLGIRIVGMILPLAAISLAAYHFIEKPMIDIGTRVAARLEISYESAIAATGSGS